MNGHDRVRRALGYLEIECRGPFLARFVNLCVSADVPLSDVRPAGDALLVCIPVGAFRRLRPMARATHTRVHIARRGGLLFLWRRLRRRRLLIACAFLSLAVIYHLSGFVWFVDVSGTEMLPVEAVESRLEQAGLYPGAAKSRLDVNAIRSALLLSDLKLAWAAIDISGTRARVRVVEEPSNAARQYLAAPGDIVAGRDGQLVQVLVLAGTPVARVGDVVRRGEPLIAGRPGPPAGGGVRARGVCGARVWYECYREAALRVPRVTYTGRSFTQILISFNGRDIILSGWQKAPFAAYRTSETARHLALWRNIRVPVEVITRRFDECTESWVTRPAAEATAEARAAARQWLGRMIPRDAQVVNESERTITVTPGVVGVRLLVETREDIGRFLPFDPGSRPSAAQGATVRG